MNIFAMEQRDYIDEPDFLLGEQLEEGELSVDNDEDAGDDETGDGLYEHFRVVADRGRIFIIKRLDVLIDRRLGNEPEFFGIVGDVVLHQNGVAHGGIGNVDLVLVLQHLLCVQRDERAHIDKAGALWKNCSRGTKRYARYRRCCGYRRWLGYRASMPYRRYLPGERAGRTDRPCSKRARGSRPPADSG